MKLFKVIKYYEAYEEHIVSAETAEQAEEMVMSGESEPEEVTVKESDITSCDPVSIIDYLYKGDSVNVTRKEGDQFNHNFTGHVKKVDFKKNLITVEDQDGDCWDCDPDQVSFSSDGEMHDGEED